MDHANIGGSLVIVVIAEIVIITIRPRIIMLAIVMEINHASCPGMPGILAPKTLGAGVRTGLDDRRVAEGWASWLESIVSWA